MPEGTTDNPASAWSADELVPFGKYLLLDRIASGASAALYRARVRGEAGFQRLVAIKRILPHMAGDEEFVRTFVREAKTAALLLHTNVCPIYELGKVGDSLYMAMECIAGKDLGRITRRLAKKGETMPPVIAAWIAARVCDALDYAHNLKGPAGQPAGIVHRDLSPTNIVVSYEGQVKLIDFGLAKAVGRAQQTNVDALKQKLGYMSPEMVKGRPLDARSDVFGVGICLYELLTSRRLFAGGNDMETLSLVANASIPPPSSVVEDPPEQLEMIVMRALKRDPDERFASAAEMAQALTEFLRTADPLFGPNQLADWMTAHFAGERDEEHQRLTKLLEASNDAAVMAERRRFFASPTGAAALGKAEVRRRLSTEPPPVMSAEGVAPVEIPKMPGAPSLGEAQAAFGTDEEEATSFYGATTRRRGKSDRAEPPKDAAPAKDSVPEGKDSQPTVIAASAVAAAASEQVAVAPRGDAPTAETQAAPAQAAPAQAAPASGSESFDEEATAFYGAPKPAADQGSGGFDAESTVHLAPGDVDDMELGDAGAGDSLGFEEEATTIFFNTEDDGGGVEERLQRIDQGAELAVASVPVAPSPAAIALPAHRPPLREAPTTASGTRSPFAPRQGSGWVVAALAVLALGLAAVVVRTPVGIALGLRAPLVGAIEVRTRPEIAATVELDEVYRGQTPLRMDGVPAGKRRVRIEAKGYRPVVRDVHLPRGATAILDVALVAMESEPSVAPPPPPPPTPTPSPAPAPEPSVVEASPPASDVVTTAPSVPKRPAQPRATRPKRPADAPRGAETPATSAQPRATADDVGKLTINSVPWAHVTIDGKDTGKNTPVLSFPVSPGTHSIRLETPDGKVHTEEVTVQAGETLRVIKRF